MQVLVSPQEIMSCCNYCGDGCKGGDPAQAWDYWYNSGVVSGGLYGNTETCQPYSIKPCEHHVEGPRPKCNDKEPTPKCEHQCQDKYPKHFTEDKHYGKHSYGISRQNEKIQMELMNNGPIEAAFTVYEDFLNYKSGVYQHIHGKVLGGHAVRVLGWGVENGAAYWLVSNSWNTDWGDKGAFKILRGHNECGIEHYLVAGMPDFDRTK
jgi:cathepsin B